MISSFGNGVYDLSILEMDLSIFEMILEVDLSILEMMGSFHNRS